MTLKLAIAIDANTGIPYFFCFGFGPFMNKLITDFKWDDFAILKDRIFIKSGDTIYTRHILSLMPQPQFGSYYISGYLQSYVDNRGALGQAAVFTEEI